MRAANRVLESVPVMAKHVKTAVIPAAGLGTRWLPQSLAMPKELIPLVDRPVLHYVVEEAAAARIRRIVLVIAPGKEAMLNYFTHPKKLVDHLKAEGRLHEIEPLLTLLRRVEVCAVYQDEPRGLGHAILCARDEVGSDPFAVLLPDEVFDGDPTPLSQLLPAAGADDGAVSLLEVPKAEVGNYGIVEAQPEGEFLRVWQAVEKPKPEKAPSRLALVGRYVLPADTFKILEKCEPSENGEIQLTSALAKLASQGRLLGARVECKRFDTGQPRVWFEANEYFGKKIYGQK